MNCPICGKDLVEIELGECWFLACCNSKCRCQGVASGVVWEFLTVVIKNRKALSQELIRTRKALDKALHYLDAEYYAYIMVHKKEPELIAKVLAEIKTALEQKDE